MCHTTADPYHAVSHIALYADDCGELAYLSLRFLRDARALSGTSTGSARPEFSSAAYHVPRASRPSSWTRLLSLRTRFRRIHCAFGLRRKQSGRLRSTAQAQNEFNDFKMHTPQNSDDLSRRGSMQIRAYSESPRFSMRTNTVRTLFLILRLRASREGNHLHRQPEHSALSGHVTRDRRRLLAPKLSFGARASIRQSISWATPSHHLMGKISFSTRPHDRACGVLDLRSRCGLSSSLSRRVESI